MSDDVQALTARLAADPESLAFLLLGEALRRRGQLAAALAVALRGVGRHPSLADAHDLVGRIRSDRREGDLAFDAWTEALRLEPRHLGALRGLAFLAFRSGDLARAKRHLEAAVALAPADATLRAALARVAEQGRGSAARPPEPGGWEPAAGTLLVDLQGRRLTGSLRSPTGAEVSDQVAARLAGVSREAVRAVRLLGLGAWRSVVMECPGAHLVLTPPTEDTLLLTTAGGEIPAGQAALLAERTAGAARRWLERLA